MTDNTETLILEYLRAIRAMLHSIDVRLDGIERTYDSRTAFPYSNRSACVPARTKMTSSCWPRLTSL